MKAHDAAKTLETIAQMLREGDDMELTPKAVRRVRSKGDATPLGANAPAALALLVKLSAYSKSEWRSLIAHLDLHVEVKATDSVRDILGRLLKYLER